MLDKMYFCNGHLTALAFLMLEHDGLDCEEKQLILAHISDCDDCMELYLESLTEDSLLEPSEDLPNRIMNVIQSQQETKKATKTLIIQFTKLGIAVCLTMVIFFSGAFGFTIGSPYHMEYSEPIVQEDFADKEYQEKESIFSSISNSFNESFIGFADKINLGFKGVD